MEDILEVYKRPYDSKHPVICMDETSKQHIRETRFPLPMRPRYVERYDTEYERNGVSNIFMFCEPLRGWRKTKVTNQRTKVDWAHVVRELVDEDYPDAEKITMVLDNLNTHTGSSLYEAFPPEEARRILERLDFHYTPKHGSWLNIAEIELSVLGRQCLNRRIPDQENLKKEVNAWNETRNNQLGKVDWQFTTQDARIKLKRLYPLILM